MSELHIQVYENQRLVHSVKCAGLVELGRQDTKEEGPFTTYQKENRWRVVVARKDEQFVPRYHLTAELLATGKARITNRAEPPKNSPISFLDGSKLEAGRSQEMSLPVFLVVGNKNVVLQSADMPPVSFPQVPVAPAKPTPRVEAPPAGGFRLIEGDQATPLQTLEAMTPPGAILTGRPRPSAAPSEFQNETMIRWLQVAMDVLQSAANSSEFFDKAAAALVDLVGLDSGQVLLYQDGTWRMQAHKVAAHNRLGEERQASRHVLNHILAEKGAVFQVPVNAPVTGSLIGVNAVVAAPILDKNRAVLGVLYGDRQASGFRAGLSPLTKLDALLVELLASGVAAGVARMEQEQAERQRQKKVVQYERELQIGQNIQSGFLPEILPQPPGWEIVAHFKPAREVAGDFYDCFPMSADHVVLVMADVCDKGVGAALFMALFRSLIRAFCVQAGLKVFMGLSSDEEVKRSDVAILPASRRRAALLGDLITLLTVEHTNNYVTSNHASACMFVTLFIGTLDTTTGELTYVNAGHDSPTIIGPKGIKTRLEPTGPAVGMLADASFDLSKIRLEPGDILLTHTDGVTDARDPAGKSFTEKRFLAILQEGAPSATALVERLVSELRTHIGAADQFDDITLLAARWAPQEPPSGAGPTPSG